MPDLAAYEGTHLYDLGVAIVIGVAAAVVVTAVHVVGVRVDGLRGWLGPAMLLVGGGLAVGVIAAIADVLGADSQDVLFSGQASVPAVVAADSTKVVVILLVAKFLAYAVSLGFLGVALASLAVVWFDVSPTLAIAVGAAAGMTAQTRLLLSPRDATRLRHPLLSPSSTACTRGDSDASTGSRRGLTSIELSL